MSDNKGVSSGDVLDVVGMVTTAVLGAEAVPGRPEASVAPSGPLWRGRVSITGPFNGAVDLVCSREFAMRAARAMFLPPGNKVLNDEAARDALAELTNIIGGNLKALFSNEVGACRLSLPTVSVSPGGETQDHKLNELWFECTTDSFKVIVSASEPANDEGKR